MNNVLLGKTLKVMYKMSGKTLNGLADETGLTVDTINNLFYARIQKPGFAGVCELTGAMGFSVKELVGFMDSIGGSFNENMNISDKFNHYLFERTDGADNLQNTAEPEEKTEARAVTEKNKAHGFTGKNDTQAVTDKNNVQSVTDKYGTQSVTENNEAQSVADKYGTQSVTENNEAQSVKDKYGTQSVTENNEAQSVADKYGTRTVTENNEAQSVKDKYGTQVVTENNEVRAVTEKTNTRAVSENRKAIVQDTVFSYSEELTNPESIINNLSRQIELLNTEHEKQLDRFKNTHLGYVEQMKQQYREQTDEMKDQIRRTRHLAYASAGLLVLETIALIIALLVK